MKNYKYNKYKYKYINYKYQSGGAPDILTVPKLYLQQIPELYLQQPLKIVVPKDKVFLNIKDYTLTIDNFNNNINDIYFHAVSKETIICTICDKINNSYHTKENKLILLNLFNSLYTKAKKYTNSILDMIAITNKAFPYFIQQQEVINIMTESANHDPYDLREMKKILERINRFNAQVENSKQILDTDYQNFIACNIKVLNQFTDYDILLQSLDLTEEDIDELSVTYNKLFLSNIENLIEYINTQIKYNVPIDEEIRSVVIILKSIENETESSRILNILYSTIKPYKDKLNEKSITLSLNNLQKYLTAIKKVCNSFIEVNNKYNTKDNTKDITNIRKCEEIYKNCKNDANALIISFNLSTSV